MKKTLHKLGAMTATLCIATFFVSTLVVELFGSADAIAQVKQFIVMPGLFILVPAIAVAGATGFGLGKNRRGKFIEGKKRRMPFIAMLGILVLIPAAIVLNMWAAAGAFDTKFYVLQLIELAAGATNLTLMAMNIRDGLKMSGRMPARPNV